MRILSLVITLGLLALGCTDSSRLSAEEMEQERSRARAEMKQVEQELAATRARLVTRISALEGDLTATGTEHESTVRDYEQRLKLKDQRINELVTDLNREKAHTRKLQSALDAAPTTATLSPPPSPSLAAKPVYPLTIYAVEGKHAVVGTRTRPRPVDSEELYRDKYGNKKPIIDYEDVTDNEYELQVRFSVTNLTAQEQKFSARAGRGVARFTIGAGEVMTNATVKSAHGSGLFIEAGGTEKRYHVSY